MHTRPRRGVSHAMAEEHAASERYDLILVHPPFLLMRDAIPTCPIPWNLGHVGSVSYIGKYPVGPSWTSAPMGLTTMRNYVQAKSDFRVDIQNLAALRYAPPAWAHRKYHAQARGDWSVLTDLAEATQYGRTREIVRRMHTALFGVDLHWVVYAQGALETLRLIKELHPESLTLLGGFTASYFAEELIQSYPFLDFVIVGDGSVPLLRLLEEINGSQRYGDVPNLVYREDGRLRRGPRAVLNDAALVEGDPEVSDSVPLGRGCSLSCITCGGSHPAMPTVATWDRPVPYRVESIMQKLLRATRHSRDLGVFLIHDPLITLGRATWESLMEEIRRSGLPTNFLIEFFAPHAKEDVYRIARMLPGSFIQISPESMDEEARALHKNLRYSNADLIATMDAILDTGELSLAVWFMAGLAKDSKLSVDATLAFVREYYGRIDDVQKNMLMYNEMMFIDPGSLAFQDPTLYGYRLTKRTLAEHAEAFALPFFKHHLTYETAALSRDALFDLFLYMHDQMNVIYRDVGVLRPEHYARVSRYNALLRKYEPRYDAALSIASPPARTREFMTLGTEFREELASA